MQLTTEAGMDTAFTRLVGCTVPLQQAGMGGAASPDLAVAVTDAGALGMVGMPMAPPAEVAEVLESVGQRTAGPVGVNFLMPFVDREAVAAAAGRCRLVEFFYGEPDAALVALVHEGGGLVGWQVGSVDEARAAAGAGCDLVVAQGVEAGGHVRGRVALLPLLEAVLEAVDVPVVAAGGIATARTMAAVLAAGAAAARVGTRFVATAEADAHQSYVEALIAAGPDDTVLTTTFSVLWPDAPHRVLRSCVEAAQAIHDDVVGEMEMPGGARVPVARLSPPCPGRRTTGRTDAMALYAGQSVGAVHQVDRAADVVRELAEGAEALLKGRRS
ncbi:MAG TPA: nitronate monooxygenase [Acidimicrobiales bacterium]|jgi:NAD(P)H-dependent flavin oxidoreductase YrpB (nitropropane dioxygenase family)|nr:nitronate monooxygenase [Acidimicrobiales bacterium]